jgi:hypothetical protein
MDRRKAERFNTQLRCFLTPVGRPAGRITGSSENLSRVGILVKVANSTAALMLAAGDDVAIDLLLPNNREPKSRCLHCLATVTGVRAGSNGDLYVAGSIQQMSFRDLPPRFDAAVVPDQQPKFLV